MVQVGDLVKREIPPGVPASLRKGHMYMCLDIGETGIVAEIHDTYVLIEGFGGWPFHKATLRVIKRGSKND